MAIYRLRRIDSQIAVDTDASNNDDALAKFAQRLGVALSFEGPAAPQYMMGLVPKEAFFAKPEDIPVYEAE